MNLIRLHEYPDGKFRKIHLDKPKHKYPHIVCIWFIHPKYMNQFDIVDYPYKPLEIREQNNEVYNTAP